MKRRDRNINRDAYILFTREPEAGKTKTRLMPYFNGIECKEIHECFLKDIRDEVRHIDADLVVAYTGGKPDRIKKIFGSNVTRICQRGNDIWERMDNAIADVMALGYRRVVLTGADIPEISAKTIRQAFSSLRFSDVVLGPSDDGGYYLIGVSARHREVFSIDTSNGDSVFDATCTSARNAGLRVSICDSKEDVDTPEDVARFMTRMRMKSNRRLRRSHTGRYLANHASVSIIIPVYNEKSTIEALIEQLRSLTNDSEIIFVDGGSSDDTLKIIDRFARNNEVVRIIRSDKGRGKQLNRGAEAATGDILFFLHCDSIIPDNTLTQIREVMSAHEWGYFGVKFSSNNFFMLTNRINSNLRASARKVVFGDQGIFIDRRLFHEIGGFREISIMEDYEFSLRLREKKIRPGRARNSLSTSSRRYGKGSLSILRTELMMFYLRAKFRSGADPEEIAKLYGDIR